MNIIRRGAVALAVLTSVGVPTALLAASTASAAPPPPVVIHTTSIQGKTVHISPRVSILNFKEYTPNFPASEPGFSNTSDLTEVCVTVPHVVPPGPFTVLARCNWLLRSTAHTVPVNTLRGSSVINGEGQIGRVLGGTGIWNHATGLAASFLSLNLAPKVSADTFVFHT